MVPLKWIYSDQAPKSPEDVGTCERVYMWVHTQSVLHWEPDTSASCFCSALVILLKNVVGSDTSSPLPFPLSQNGEGYCML